jgi:hypothetical protein
MTNFMSRTYGVPDHNLSPGVRRQQPSYVHTSASNANECCHRPVVSNRTTGFFCVATYYPPMMATTHALAGLVLAALVATATGDLGMLPVAAAALGGLFPDFDLYAGHRKTLHFPVYFSLMAGVAALVAAASWTPVTAAVALFFGAAALHSVSDMFGGGLELKPWLGTSDRAVYDHFRGKWIAPRRWIRYDGAPEDLAVAMALAVPGVLVFDGVVELGIVAAIAVSGVYVLLRKPMVIVAERLVEALPATVLGYVPRRFVEDFQ